VSGPHDAYRLFAARALADQGVPPGETLIDRVAVEEAILAAMRAGAKIERARRRGVRHCWACGCTQTDACTPACWWVGEHLCSRCSGAQR
jgi:hypothetical protein